MKIMFIQNRIFTAEAPLPAGRQGGRRESIFCLAGDTAKQEGFRPFNASLIMGAIALKRLRSSS
jgi:hypothetical protein